MKTPYCTIDGKKYQLEISKNGVLRFPNDGRKMPDVNQYVKDYINGKRPLSDLFDYHTNSGSSYETVYGLFSKGGCNNHITTQGPEPTKKFRLYLGNSFKNK